jgi:hypothetical protein
VWEEGGPMLDLNTLIAPGSGFQLTNAFNINDRGEILAKAAPLGFTPHDDADLGHLVLLIPCEGEHADDAGCEDGAETAIHQRSVPVIGAARTAGQSSGTANETAARIRGRFGRNRGLTPWPQR